MNRQYGLVLALSWMLLLPAGGAWAQTTIKLATVAPEGSQWMQEMRAGAAEIKRQTDGRVQLKFFGGGVMGTDKKVLRKIRIGQLNGGAFTATALAERYPAINIYGTPLLFESFDEVDYVRERMDAELQAGLEAKGFVTFGFAEGGFAYLMSNEPVADVTDLVGRKVWVPEGDKVSFLAMETLGLSPVVLPITDVLTGLQTSLLDVVATSPVGALVLQWHTKVDYLTDLPVSYLIGFLAIENKVFKRLSKGDQAIVRSVLSETYARLDATAREDNAKALDALEQAGIDFVSPKPAQVLEWRAQLEGLNQQLATSGELDAQFMGELLGHLEAYRQRSAQVSDSP